MRSHYDEIKQSMASSRQLLLILIGTLLLSSKVSAAELSESWVSVRALGMGNAYSAVVDDGDSLFYNPAGLAKASGFSWTVFDIHAGINGPETITNLQKIVNSTSENMSENLESLYGKPIWLHAAGKSAMTFGSFGAAYYTSNNAGIFLTNPANPTMNLNYFSDMGITLGVGFDLVPKIIHFGLGARRVTRTGTTLPIGPSVLAELDVDSLTAELRRKGVGYGFDVGTIITIPGPVSPSLSFVYKNIGSIQFSHDEGAGAPPPIAGEMVIGGSLLIDTPIISIRPAFDYKHAGNSSEQLGKKLHVGLEIDLPLIDLRAGFHQGYYTAGVGLGLGILSFDVATYGVELGEYPGQHEDRRYMAQVTFELGFDPGKFGFGGSGSGKSGERRRLKQRR